MLRRLTMLGAPRVAFIVVAWVVALHLSAASAWALEPINKSFFGGVAIKGQDPVAYFLAGQPVEGNSDFEYEWMDATWRFSNQENLERFKADPTKYAPQYGGYCAYAVSIGSTADIDPEAWTIVNGKLYLNLSPSIQKLWAGDIPGRIAKANINWPKLLAE